MATYYTSSGNQKETSMIYSRENFAASYPETQFLSSNNTMMYMNPPVSVSYADALAQPSHESAVGGMEAADSASQENQVLSNLGSSSRIQELRDFGSWREGGNRNGILLMHPMTGPTSILQTGQGLSLSLGSQILPGIHQMNHLIPFRHNPNPGASGEEQSRTNEYAPHGFTGVNQNWGMARTIPNSKYLKAAQQLLDEVVNVKKALRQFQPDREKNQENLRDQQSMNSKEGGGGDMSSNQQESSTSPSSEISHAERQELQSKLTKLLSMLDEVDTKYKQYHHQMQIVVSSFDVIAGCGAAKPYTALALQTISRHFRCLRDTISGQILATRKSLGEQDSLDNKGVSITRLRYVDQQLKQQRALQQLGMMQQHAWRPQRGLPESSVSILRAWLFEHFLHPYPKDSDKIMLARQTGLTRSQVSNWFINARVRLWKPMVEEMYKEEFTDTEMDSNSSSENAAKTTKGENDTRTCHDRPQDFPQHKSLTGKEITDSIQSQTQSQQNEPKHDHIMPDVETGYGHGSGAGQCSAFPDAIVHHGHLGGGNRFVAAAPPYHMAEMVRFGGGVSLTLGLQNFEGSSGLGISGVTHHSFPGMREDDDIYNNVTEDFEYVNPGNQQHRLSSSRLLHDFVA